MIVPKLMGVVNVTPDSFSDGGRFFDEAAAVSHALRLLDEGADLLDIGGESTRPRAEPVTEADELARVLPVIRGVLAQRPDAVISIDTMKPAIASAAVAAGAEIWNDVTALRFSPDSPAVAAELGCGVVLMHMLGEPRTMQADPRYDDVVADVSTFLTERAEAAVRAGVDRSRIQLDPGLGFGKTLEHNLALLRAIPQLKTLGCPVVIGASRKSSIGRLDPSATRAEDRLGGSIALALWSATHGADMLRVHDVKETRQALRVWAAVAGSADP